MSSLMNLTLYNFRKFLRTRILYGIFFIALLFIYLISSLNAFGIGSHPFISIESVLFLYEVLGLALILAVSAYNIRRDIENRTIYLILSKPVTKVEYILGKIFSCAVYLLIFTLITIAGALIMLRSGIKSYEGMLVLAIIMKFLYLFIILGLSIFFSVFLRPTILVAVISLCYFISGIDNDYIELIVAQNYPGPVLFLLKLIKFVLPNKDYLDISYAVMQGAKLHFAYFIAVFFYIAGYSVFTLLLSAWAFKEKEF